VPLDRISFKGTVDSLRQWSPIIANLQTKPKRQSSYEMHKEDGEVVC
jgi:hypothetical protein